MNSPKIIDTRGNLPPFSPDSAAFFANLLGLFFGNKGKTDLLHQTVSGVESYGGRLLPIIDLLFRGKKNVLVLERAPAKSLTAYFLDDLGLTLPETRSLPYPNYIKASRHIHDNEPNSARDLLGEFSPEISIIDGFVTDPDLERIASHLGKRTVSTAAGSLRGNNKYLLHKHLESIGLPVFETCEAATPADLLSCLATLAKSGYKNAVLKSPLGASGIGIAKLPIDATGDQIKAIPTALFEDGPCMVQGWMERGFDGVARIRSPSVQLYLDADHVYLYDVTEQILGGDSVHEGNESPPPYLDQLPWLRGELFSQAAEAGKWLHAQGYRGTASVDYLVAYFEQRRDPEIRICEINARVTGATYPAVLAHHFIPGGAWLMRNLTFKIPIPPDYLLTLLRSFKHLFTPDQNNPGVLPINFVTDENDEVTKGQFLCLADLPERCHPLFNSLQRDLPVDWHYSRD